MEKHRLTTDSKEVWIKDPYHPYYPEYVQILEVLTDGYKVQVLKGDKPIIVVKEEQVTDHFFW